MQQLNRVGIDVSAQTLEVALARPDQSRETTCLMEPGGRRKRIAEIAGEMSEAEILF